MRCVHLKGIESDLFTNHSPQGRGEGVMGDNIIFIYMGGCVAILAIVALWAGWCDEGEIAFAMSPVVPIWPLLLAVFVAFAPFLVVYKLASWARCALNLKEGEVDGR
jgi:hypothetical protein